MNDDTNTTGISADKLAPLDDAAPTSTEIVDPNSTRSLYEEALAELQTNDRDEAKAIIAARIKEITRMRVLLARAEADLAKLLEKTPAEIAMMRF